MPDQADRPAPGERSLGAMVVGVAAGLVIFGGAVAAAILLYQRTYADSMVALLLMLVLFGGFGAYLAWLVGVLVFSAVRRAGDGASG